MEVSAGSSVANSLYPQYHLSQVLRDIFTHLSFLIRTERSILGIVSTYAVAIGLLLLCVPIAVQELVSTFSFAMEPRMIFTLTVFVAASLTGVAAFRVLQARAVETLQQRLYTRVALSFTRLLPRMLDDVFAPNQAHRFMEADLLTRAIVAMLADLVNVLVGGTIAMVMLVLFHPFFCRLRAGARPGLCRTPDTVRPRGILHHLRHVPAAL